MDLLFSSTFFVPLLVCRPVNLASGGFFLVESGDDLVEYGQAESSLEEIHDQCPVSIRGLSANSGL